MTTSIRDLLNQVAERQLRRQTDGADPAAAIDARLVIGTASTILDKLDVWRPDWTLQHPGRRLANQLQTACAAVQDGNGPHPAGRSQNLMAATADAVGSLCSSSTPAADRWEITIAVADIVRRSTSTYFAHGPVLQDPAIAAARTAAVAVAHAGLQTPPHEGQNGLIDLPIPTSPSLLSDPLLRAAAAAGEIEHVLARAAFEDSRGFASLYELRALALTFENAVHRAGLALGVASEATAAAWAEVRHLARQLHDGQRPVIDGPEILLRRSAQLHHDLARSTLRPPKPVDQIILTEILQHVANSADRLTHHVRRMAGRAYARADRFPVLESRVHQHLRQEPFIANIDDLQVVHNALRTAEHDTRLLAGPSEISFEDEPYPLTNPLSEITAPGRGTTIPVASPSP